MARAIVRRAGVRASAEVAASGVGAPILSIPGTRRGELFANVLHCGVGPKNFAVTDSGKMYGWGRDTKTFGVPGGALTYSSPRRMHPEITDAIQFATNDEFTFCVREDGHVSSDDEVSAATADDFHWEEIPQLPSYTNPTTTVPFTDVVMAATTTPVEINNDQPMYLLRGDGTVWAKGDFMPGAVGASDAYDAPGFTFTGTLPNWTKLSPTKLGGGVVSILAQGDYLIFLRDDGVVRTWAFDDANPFTIASAPSNIVKMAGSSGAVNVLTADGEIWSAGSNSQGQAGILASSNTTTLNALSNTLGSGAAAFRKTIGDGYTDVAGAVSSTFAIKDGRLWSWGIGGVRSARGASAGVWGAPQEVVDPDIDDVEILHHGYQTSNGMYKSASSGVYIWGLNTNGSLGQGYLSPTTGSGVPIPLNVPTSASSWPAP